MLPASSPLRKTMEFAGFTYSESASSSNSVTFWRKQMGLPSGRPKALAVVVVTAIASRTQRGSFMFQTQLSLDGELVSERFSPQQVWMAPEEFVVHQVPGFGTLFELEDFYERGNVEYQGLDDVPNGPDVLVPLLTGGSYVGA